MRFSDALVGKFPNTSQKRLKHRSLVRATIVPKGKFVDVMLQIFRGNFTAIDTTQTAFSE